MQSELDATQQEFENTVEELGAKDEDLIKLKGMLKDLQAELKELRSDKDEHVEKVICSWKSLNAHKGHTSNLFILTWYHQWAIFLDFHNCFKSFQNAYIAKHLQDVN